MATYTDYLDLGFERTEWNDDVCEKKYGYGGYFLVKKLSKQISIEVDWQELEKPKMWFETKEGILNHTIMTFEQVKELLTF